jgi:hypothetical protein
VFWKSVKQKKYSWYAQVHFYQKTFHAVILVNDGSCHNSCPVTKISTRQLCRRHPPQLCTHLECRCPEQTPNTLMTRPLKDVKQVTQYVDGLGRILQTVAKQGSYPSGGSVADMITMVEYDALGREPFKYLPSPATSSDGNFKLNPFAQQATFYNSANTSSPLYSQGETFLYGQTNFEASP